ncbi:hypothetical protein DI383_11490 [Flavobacteriaceae bacterium LYZ1037]|nr:hypothetical protein DI383_11490 [Flavobacteriaceae bacterium LYZ1037]
MASILFTFAQENTIELKVNDKNEITEPVPFNIIEQVPVYKGCDENMGSQALMACFGEKVSALISKNFDSTIANNLGLPDQSNIKIQVTFNINQEGQVVDIVAKTEYPELEAEAIRVVNLIPNLKPGYFKDEPVIVPYSLPIKFQVSNPKLAKGEKFPVYRSCDETLSFEAQKECTTNKIKDYIKVSINYDLADKLFPLDKSTQFLVNFTINKKGKTENITAKAHKKEMAAEAINVLRRMPKLKEPGYKYGKPVDTKMEILMTIYF